MSTARPLSRREHALISTVLAQLPTGTARPLTDQLDRVTVRSADVATVLDLDVPDQLPPASIVDGPLPVRAIVPDAGEVLIWITSGRLSGLEFAWVTDEPPTQWPSPDELTIL